MKFGAYNKLHLYFQLNETTWCLIGFHANNSQINNVTGGRHLGFLNFQILLTFVFHGSNSNNSQINNVTGGRRLGFLNCQILFKFSLLYLKLMRKQHLAVEIHKIVRFYCEVVSI